MFLAVCRLTYGERICVNIADFAAAHAAEFGEVLRRHPGTPSHAVQDPGHGRAVRRTASVVAAPAEARALRPGLSAFGRIVSLRRVAGGRDEAHTRTFALSPRFTSSRLAMLVRALGHREPLQMDAQHSLPRRRRAPPQEPHSGKPRLFSRLARNFLEAHSSDLPNHKKIKHASWSRDCFLNAFTYVQ